MYAEFVPSWNCLEAKLNNTAQYCEALINHRVQGAEQLAKHKGRLAT